MKAQTKQCSQKDPEQWEEPRAARGMRKDDPCTSAPCTYVSGVSQYLHLRVTIKRRLWERGTIKRSMGETRRMEETLDVSTKLGSVDIREPEQRNGACNSELPGNFPGSKVQGPPLCPDHAPALWKGWSISFTSLDGRVAGSTQQALLQELGGPGMPQLLLPEQRTSYSPRLPGRPTRACGTARKGKDFQSSVMESLPGSPCPHVSQAPPTHSSYLLEAAVAPAALPPGQEGGIQACRSVLGPGGASTTCLLGSSTT